MLFVALHAHSAHADDRDDKRECVAESDSGQRLRDSGKLLEAQRAFVACAAESCPAIVRTDCGAWLSAVVPRIPSLVISLRDSTGQDIPPAKLWIDGKIVTDGAAGNALQLDPGPHTLRIQHASDLLEERVTLADGEQGRLVRFVIPVDRPTSLTSKPPDTRAWALAGSSLVALGVAVGLGLSARADRTDLSRTCGQRCSDAQLAPVRQKLLIGDIALGVSALSAGGAIWFWLTAAPGPVASAQASMTLPTFVTASGNF